MPIPSRFFVLFGVLLVLLPIGCGSSEKKSDSSDPVSAGSVIVPRRSAETRPTAVEVSLGRYPVLLEVSADGASRGRGLSGRSALAPDRGMLFAYSSASPREYWMKDCLIALDIAFVDDSGVIFKIASADPPAATSQIVSVESGGPARYVVEMAKGWFADHAVAVGTRITLSEEAQRLVRRAE